MLKSSYVLFDSIEPEFNYIQCRITIEIFTGVDKQKKNQRKIVNVFLPIIFSICFGYSKEPSHCDGSFEYPQHMFETVLFNTHNICFD